jgi:antitoxin CptB
LSEHGRLRWRCRRGTTELERLLLTFLEGHGADLTTQALQTFEALLDQEDDRLADWLINGRGEPDDDGLCELVRHIRRATGA